MRLKLWIFFITAIFLNRDLYGRDLLVSDCKENILNLDRIDQIFEIHDWLDILETIPKANKKDIARIKSEINAVIERQFKLLPEHLKNNGIKFKISGSRRPKIEIIGGKTWLGKLAEKLRKNRNIKLIYAPHDLFGDDDFFTAAFYNPNQNAIYLPHASLTEPNAFNPQVLHEVRHASGSFQNQPHALNIFASTDKKKRFFLIGKNENEFESLYANEQHFDEATAFLTEAIGNKVIYKNSKFTDERRSAASSFYYSVLASRTAAVRNQILSRAGMRLLNDPVKSFSYVKLQRRRPDRFKAGVWTAYLNVEMRVQYRRKNFLLQFEMPPIEMGQQPPEQLNLVTLSVRSLIRDHLLKAKVESFRVMNIAAALRLK